MVYVCIKPGLTEGERHTLLLKQALESSGFETSKYEDADAVIAHSTACYDLPLKTPANYFILVDPPYWPGKSLWKRLWEEKISNSKKINKKYGLKYTFQKIIWELTYIVTKPGYILMAFKNDNKLDFLNVLKDKHVLIVRNENDTMCTATIHVALAPYKNVYYRTVPGMHDDLYENPQPYIDLLPKNI